ncbi:MAG: cytochrome c5 family protein [Betaproteobacteria bacterium]|nr:cytochrome c5 family protein [Betaproteobacteria bacterium]
MDSNLQSAASRRVGTIPKSLALACAMAIALALAPQLAQAQGRGQSGKAVVESACVTCHGAGVDGAPRIGDRKAWTARAGQGLTGLSRSALQGIRKMPAHGGNAGLSDIEIQRAITYMVNASGGQWTAPIDRTARPAARSGEQVVRAQCAQCHEAGVNGAPAIGDRLAWVPRAKQGFEVLVRSAINGHGGMPPRGGEADLTDAEIASAIAFMLNPVSSATTASAPAVAVPVRDANRRTIDGMEILFGATSADALRKQHTGADPESKMHGGIPQGKSYYHLNVSLFDAATRDAIKDAYVEAKIADPVMGDQVKVLEPMVFNNTTSYGNYFRLSGKAAQTVAIVIRKSGEVRATETKFSLSQ